MAPNIKFGELHNLLETEISLIQQISLWSSMFSQRLFWYVWSHLHYVLPRVYGTFGCVLPLAWNWQPYTNVWWYNDTDAFLYSHQKLLKLISIVWASNCVGLYVKCLSICEGTENLFAARIFHSTVCCDQGPKHLRSYSTRIIWPL